MPVVGLAGFEPARAPRTLGLSLETAAVEETEAGIAKEVAPAVGLPDSDCPRSGETDESEEAAPLGNA